MTQEELLAGLVVAVDKPRQWTSFQVVNKIKATIRTRYDLKKFKIGHAGTLDPLATGVLLVCVGKATKHIDELQSGEKVYSGTFVLGATTPCYDQEQAIDCYYPYAHITRERIEAVLPQFMGTIQQVPPIFSAVKINGQRAYHYARRHEGEESPQPTAKEIQIVEFDITGFRPGVPEESPSSESPEILPEASASTLSHTDSPHLYNHPQCEVPPHLPQLDFRIRCGKGTYIRSIARDLGMALDSGAFLSSLRREQVGNYTIADAVTLDRVARIFES